MDNITVLMSTYNGETYLKEQLESIFNQKDVKVKLIVRDDCSTDNTIDLLKRYKNKCDITIIEGKKNLGPCMSFLQMMCKYNQDEYYALADQDDVWDLDKLKIGIEKIKRFVDRPALYCSNLRVVDNELNFYRNSHASPKTSSNKFSSYTENLAVGCTIVYNRALAQLINGRKPERFSMHDDYIYRVSRMFGEFVYDFSPHINYRQHGHNSVGATLLKVDLGKIKSELDFVFSRSRNRQYINAIEFYKAYQDMMSEMEKEKNLKLINYNKNLRSNLNLLFDKDFDSDNLYRRLRFKIQILLRTI